MSSMAFITASKWPEEVSWIMAPIDASRKLCTLRALVLNISTARWEGSDVCRKDTAPDRVSKPGLIASPKVVRASSEDKMSMASKRASFSSVYKLFRAFHSWLFCRQDAFAWSNSSVAAVMNSVCSWYIDSIDASSRPAVAFSCSLLLALSCEMRMDCCLFATSSSWLRCRAPSVVHSSSKSPEKVEYISERMPMTVSSCEA
mmetsp:Transcript_44252/g.117286  ORF Transcript_44252/g.117286 Transcript_44252/m.117286 type:complete len:202 (+) Transcript_44252:994-1599(+)